MTTSSLRGKPVVLVAPGAMSGPPVLTRIDLAPSVAHASSQTFAIAMPSRRSAGSRCEMLRGALLETWWQATPVVTRRDANVSSHLFDAAVDGSNSYHTPSPCSRVVLRYMASSVTSPNSADHRSILRTPGNVSMVNCGKSSMVSSRYFFFIARTACACAGVAVGSGRRLKRSRIG